MFQKGKPSHSNPNAKAALQGLRKASPPISEDGDGPLSEQVAQGAQGNPFQPSSSTPIQNGAQVDRHAATSAPPKGTNHAPDGNTRATDQAPSKTPPKEKGDPGVKTKHPFTNFKGKHAPPFAKKST